jgi:hypothetical protein
MHSHNVRSASSLDLGFLHDPLIKELLYLSYFEDKCIFLLSGQWR